MTVHMMTAGKCLAELAHEVDVLHKAIKTVTDDQASICWQDDGTLCYFSYHDGYPGCYYAPWTDFANNKEDFSSLEKLLQFMKNHIEDKSDKYLQHLLTGPVWQVIEEGSKARSAGEDVIMKGQEKPITDILELQVNQAIKRLDQGMTVDQAVQSFPEHDRELLRAWLSRYRVFEILMRTRRLHKLNKEQTKELKIFLDKVTEAYITSLTFNLNDIEPFDPNEIVPGVPEGLNNELPPEENGDSDERTDEEIWELSSAKTELKFQMHDDMQMIANLIKRLVATHQYLASPYPAWQYAESISKRLAETDWKNELEPGDKW